jgi:thiamine-monophosphate kinase
MNVLGLTSRNISLKMFENKENRTELEELGEFGLIKHITQSVVIKNPETIKGIGDDAAVISPIPTLPPDKDRDRLGEGEKPVMVVTTDMLVEGIHFDLTFSPLKHLGYKAVVVNLSDVYAMNAVPKQIVISLGLSNRFSLEAVEELYEGINLACEKYGVDLVGGDTTTSRSGLILSVTAIGYAGKKEDIVYRNSAKATDLICVSGDLGAAYLGLQLLNREKKVFLENPKVQPELSGYDYLLERQLKPEARADVIELLRKTVIKPTSMIDISDGLSSELFHICTQSKVGCQVYEDKIPIDVKTGELAEEFNLSPIICALSGGEDYELLFTVSIHDFEKIKLLKDVYIIGHITDEASGLIMIDKAGTAIQLKAQGWDAMKGFL